MIEGFQLQIRRGITNRTFCTLGSLVEVEGPGCRAQNTEGIYLNTLVQPGWRY